jgi:hypothetical protein
VKEKHFSHRNSLLFIFNEPQNCRFKLFGIIKFLAKYRHDVRELQLHVELREITAHPQLMA